ncbi:hypothetical protein VE02_03876 [Pseudogymnoascus sp. 03VT05]|nr:hypothetical protein VE02_03876 [Pseudogymnoascus sp. 03VT05]
MAMEYNWDQVRSWREHPNAKDLRKFVTTGLKRVGGFSESATRPDLLLENTTTPILRTNAELEPIKAKKASKEKKGSAFVEKANSRPSTPVN